MCGIFCILYRNSSDLLEIKELVQLIENNIRNRGPNQFGSNHSQSSEHHIEIKASVLWLQGENITAQPIETDNSIFAYNGDIFEGFETEKCKLLGDTCLFLQELEDTSRINTTLEKLQGPYSFIYFNKQNSKLYFSRDKLGRRSLLIGVKRDVLIITSVAFNFPGFNFMELPSFGTFVYDLKLNSYELLSWSNNKIDLGIIKQFLGKDLLHVNNEIQEVGGNKNDIPDFNHFKKLTLFSDALCYFTTNSLWLEKIKRLNTLLEASINKRISNQPKFCSDCLPIRKSCNHCQIGVLFSGGLDCTILALIADKFIDKNIPIDLLNVAFNTKDNTFQTPDRLTAESSFEELKTLRPFRQWNLVKINIKREELSDLCNLKIRHLIFPLKTILDESLGCALWFASRGLTEDYRTPCRVVLVGMGADELFGGYTKHRAALKHRGWDGLGDSLELDWQNISHRNLARDDRVVSDHGRQLRTPYLDEDFVDYVRSLKPWERTFPCNDVMEGKGDKFLLRSLAFYLGLTKAATFKKRALQFGSRIANKKENANDVSPRLV